MTKSELATALAASLLRHPGTLDAFLKSNFPMTIRKADGGVEDLCEFAKKTHGTVRVFNRTPLGPSNDPNLAAFQGYLGFAIQLGECQYTLVTETASRNAMTPQDLIELVNSQSRTVASEAWMAIEIYLNRNRELNNESRIPSGRIQSFIVKPENLEFFDRMIGDALSELQIEVVAAGTELVIPADLKTKLWRAPESQAFPEPVVECKWDQKIRGVDIVDLIDPQKDAAAIYKRFDEALIFFAEDKKLAAPFDWRKILRDLSDEDALNTFGFIAGVLNGGFGHKGFEIKIPANLKPLFAPTPLHFENPRDEIRSKIQEKLWMSESNKNYWERMVMTEIPFAPANALSHEKARENFESALREGLAYAKLSATDFAPQIEEAIAALSSEEPELLVGQQAGEPVNIIALLEPELARRQLLYSASFITGLFGGMGTWNDLPRAEDEEHFSKITKDMINTRQDAIAAAVSDA